MLFFNVKNEMIAEKRHTAKRTEEVLEPMNLNALKAYAKHTANRKQNLDLLSRLFTETFSTEAANTTTSLRKAVNS